MRVHESVKALKLIQNQISHFFIVYSIVAESYHLNPLNWCFTWSIEIDVPCKPYSESVIGIQSTLSSRAVLGTCSV